MISRVLSFFNFTRNNETFRNVKGDVGGGDIGNHYFFSDAGDDSRPLPDDYVAIVESNEEGVFDAVGCADPKNESVAAAGEKRIYSRNSEGEIVSEVYLKNSGEIESKNENGSSKLGADGSLEYANSALSVTAGADGSFEVKNGAGGLSLRPDGTVLINGVIISPLGTITTARGVNVDTHIHIDSTGNQTTPPLI